MTTELLPEDGDQLKQGNYWVRGLILSPARQVLGSFPPASHHVYMVLPSLVCTRQTPALYALVGPSLVCTGPTLAWYALVQPQPGTHRSDPKIQIYLL